MQARSSLNTSQNSRTERALRMAVTVQNGYNHGYSSILYCQLDRFNLL
jgi:hypothetical protein